MRFEGHLILWVTAGLSLVGPIFYGTQVPAPVPFITTKADNSIDDKPVQDQLRPNNNELQIASRTLPEIDQGVRSIFMVHAASSLEPITPTAPIEARIFPVLKGIVASDGEFRAVFTLDPSASDVTIAKVGDHLAGYWIRKINADHVEAETDSGTQTSFPLRGAGESQ
jgi:hypothetical protein